MDTRTGELYDPEFVRRFFPVDEQEHFIPVERDLTQQETFRQQIELYSPCGCGSGKKFKFCCKK